MDKKGQMMVTSIIMVTLGLVLVAYLFIPQIQESGSKSFSETLTKVNASANETFTLTHFTVLTFSTSPALTETTNYTLTDATGVVVLKSGTANQTYTASYTYEGSRYIDTATDRTLFFVLITIVIAGLIYKVAEIFGLV